MIAIFMFVQNLIATVQPGVAANMGTGLLDRFKQFTVRVCVLSFPSRPSTTILPLSNSKIKDVYRQLKRNTK